MWFSSGKTLNHTITYPAPPYMRDQNEDHVRDVFPGGKTQSMYLMVSIGLCAFLAIGLLTVFCPELIAPFFAKRWNKPTNQFKHY